MVTVVNSFYIVGIDAYVVKVGIGKTAIKESKERLEAVIINPKFEFPKMKIVINLSPSDIRKSESHFDLSMAVLLLIQSTQIKIEEIDNFGFIGELSLNEDLRLCVGALPMVMEPKNKDIRNIVVPIDNVNEASEEHWR